MAEKIELFEVSIGTGSAEQQLKDLGTHATKLSTEKVTIDTQVNSGKAITDLKKIENQVKDLNAQKAEIQVSIKANEDELKDIDKQIKRLKDEKVAIKLSANSEDAKKEIARIDSLIKDLDNSKIKVNADMSKAEADLKAIEKQASSLKDATIDVKVEADTAKLDGLKGQFAELTGGLEGQFSGLLQGFVGGLASGGVTAIAGIVTSAISSVTELVGRLNEAEQSVRGLLGLTGEQANEAAAQVGALADTYEVDINETLISARAVAKAYGIETADALQIVQDAIVATGGKNEELLPTLKEYSPFFKQAGISAKEFANFVNFAGNQGVFSDKGADLVKEFGLRINEMTPATKDALAGIGLSGDEIAKQLARGEKSIVEILGTVAASLKEVPENSVAAGTALADIFGGPGEDAGIKFIKSLSDTKTAFGELAQSTDPFVQSQERSLNATQKFNLQLLQLTEGFTTVIQELKTFGTQIISVVVDAVAPIFESLKNTINNVIQAFSGLFGGLGKGIDIFKVLQTTTEIALIPLRALFQVIEFSSKVMVGLYTIVGNLARQFVSFVTSLAPVQTVLKYVKVAFDAVYKVVADFIGLIKSGYNAVVSFFDGLTGATDKNTESTKKNNDEKEKQSDLTSRYNAALAASKAFLAQNTNDIAKNEQAQRKLTETINANNAVMKAMQDAGKGSTQDYKNLAKTTDELIAKQNEVAVATKKQGEAQKTTNAAIKSADQIINDNVAKLVEMKLKTEDLTAAYGKLFNETLKLKAAELQRADAVKEVNDDLTARAALMAQGYELGVREIAQTQAKIIGIGQETLAYRVSRLQMIMADGERAAAIAELAEQETAAILAQEQEQEKNRQELLNRTSESLGALAAEVINGQKTAAEALKEFAKTAILNLIDIYAPGIIASYATQLGPFGIAAAFGLVALLKGLVQGFSDGGEVTANGNKPIGHTDTVPAMLTPGERVINKSASQKYGQLLDFINSGGDVAKLTFNDTKPDNGLLGQLIKQNAILTQIATGSLVDVKSKHDIIITDKRIKVNQKQLSYR